LTCHSLVLWQSRDGQEKGQEDAMSTTRQVSWGDALTIEVFHTPGGLKAITNAIAVEMGPTLGSRNTFAKLLHTQSPELLGARDRWRAWVLLAALGQDPSDWGLNDDSAPASVDTEALKLRFRSRTECAVRDLNPEPADMHAKWVTHELAHIRPSAA